MPVSFLAFALKKLLLNEGSTEIIKVQGATTVCSGKCLKWCLAHRGCLINAFLKEGGGGGISCIPLHPSPARNDKDGPGSFGEWSCGA